ncbi:MAG: hypothetical protein IJF22_01280 [Clostridia bacterium]|nr:hypothetical protein [Clostridia bacterium]
MDKNFNVAFRDIIIVSVPRDEMCYPNGKQIGKGMIKEYAILSKDHKHFVLVAEFEKAIIRQTKDYVLFDGSTDRFVFSRPEFYEGICTSPLKNFYFCVNSRETKNCAISFRRLKKQNQKEIKAQLKKLIFTRENKIEQDREKYQSVFDK